MADAEDGALRLVGEALDFPAMGQDDLLDHGEAQSGTLLVRGEIRLENFLAAFGRHTGAVIADFQRGLGRRLYPPGNLQGNGLLRFDRGRKPHFQSDLHRWSKSPVFPGSPLSLPVGAVK